MKSEPIPLEDVIESLFVSGLHHVLPVLFTGIALSSEFHRSESASSYHSDSGRRLGNFNVN